MNQDRQSCFKSGISDYYRRVAAEVELRLVTNIKEIEGRVPTNDEVARYGQCAIHVNGDTEYKWRGQTVARVIREDWGHRIVG